MLGHDKVHKHVSSIRNPIVFRRLVRGRHPRPPSPSPTMFAARAALRSPALRRGIHTGPKPSSGRSSFVTSGVVLVAGLGAYAAYHSWDAGNRSRRAVPTDTGECRTSTLLVTWYINFV